MKKNVYAQKLAHRKAEELAQAHQDGALFTGSLYAVALNNLYGFGKDRLKALEEEADRILREEFGHDPELAAHGLLKRIEQIRGK